MSAEVRPLVFLGTPPASATVLRALIAEGFDIRHVITRPDAKRGRGSAQSFSAVKEVALAHGISVSHDLDWITAHADLGLLGIVVAYGRIIPTPVLESTPMINIHFSLLPRWRGAAPVERAILAGDRTTGVCIMEVEPTLDTGAVYARAEIAISSHITALDLTNELAIAGADLLVATLRAGLETPETQKGDPTYAAKISHDDLRINWNTPAIDIVRHIRAVRAFTTVDGSRVRLVEAHVEDGHAVAGVVGPHAVVGTSDGVVRLLRVQPEGKQAMDAESWLRGRSGHAHTTFD